MEKQEEIIKIVDTVIEIVTTNEQDIVWSYYDSVSDLVADLNDIKKRIGNSEKRWRIELTLLFAPTGALQEIALSSGWSEKYLKLASRIDYLVID